MFNEGIDMILAAVNIDSFLSLVNLRNEKEFKFDVCENTS